MSNITTNAIGIDFGTENSCVAVFVNDKTVVVLDEKGHLTIPSCVAYNYRGVLVGEDAKLQSNDNPHNTVSNSKTLFGREYEDTSFQIEMKRWPLEIKSDENQKLSISVNQHGKKKSKTHEQVVAMVMLKLKHIAESYLESGVQNAVITVPVAFSGLQRQEIRNAASIAGLNVLRIINDSTAAAITYGLDKRNSGERNVLIFDLGAANLSVSIVNICNGIFQVKSTAGDPNLGAYHLDTNLIYHLTAGFKKEHKIDISCDNTALQRIRTACEQAKMELMNCSEAWIDFESVTKGVGLHTKITLQEYEQLSEHPFENILETIYKALREAKMEKKQIDDVVLIGQASLMPKIRDQISNHFPGKKLIIKPKEMVACGAAIQAAILSENKSEVLKDVFLLDATSHSFGIETESGVMTTIIKKNTTIPIKISKTFTTCHYDQSAMKIQIFEGESAMTRNNTCIGKLEHSGIKPNTPGSPEIEITFDINASGNLTVSTSGSPTGNENQLKISNEKRCRSEWNLDRKVGISRKRKSDNTD